MATFPLVACSVVLVGVGLAVDNPDPPASGPDDPRLRLLIERVNTFHTRWKAGDWSAICDMLPREQRSRQTANDKADYCRPSREERRVRLLRWEIQEIWIHGNRARVAIDTTARFRMWLIVRKTARAPRDQYWMWEEGNWYVDDLIRWEWEDDKATLAWTRVAPAASPDVSPKKDGVD